MEEAGTWETRSAPRRGVGADNAKSGGGVEGASGVGLTHSRGVGGVIPAAPAFSGEGLEGVSNQLPACQVTSTVHRGGSWVETKLAALSAMSRQDPRCKFTNLAYLLNESFLARCFWELRKDAASGIDGETWASYQRDLVRNLADLVERMKRMSYRPLPVKRVWIPKDAKSYRPLGIPALEDKIVQRGMARILEAIYEVDFLDESYGFRPGRSCHQALEALDRSLMKKPVNYVVDADIKGFFDSVDHKKLVRCLKQRIVDSSFLRLVVRFLKAGVMEDGVFSRTEQGTPQGGLLSPILSNVFLHYALDCWFRGSLKRGLRGYAGLIRYADDFVICVQYRDEAELILRELELRFTQAGLSLSQEKTRLVEYGRFAAERTGRRGEKPGTFDFLGFTHYCAQTRFGGFKVGRKTSRKKYRQKLKAMNQWLKFIRNRQPLREWWEVLGRKVSGHFQYYGVSGNSAGIRQFRTDVICLAHKWINRRSQRGRYDWARFGRYLERHPLPRPRIHHRLYAISSTR